MLQTCNVVHTVLLCSGCLLAVPGDPTPRQDIEQCIRALRSPDVRIRQKAIQDIARFDTVSGETVNQIIDICKSHRNEMTMERDAFMALEKLGVRATPAIQFLTKVLLDESYPPSSQASYHAGKALEAMGPAATPAIPALMIAIHSERVATRSVAVDTLGAIGADAGVAVPALFEMALHDTGGGFIWGIQDKSRRALAKIGGPAVPVLQEALTCESDRHREVASFALKLMTLDNPRAAMPTKTALRKAMRDGNARVRVDAALAYWNLSRDVEEVRPLLLSVIRNYLRDRDEALAAGRSPGYPPEDVDAAVVGLRYLGAGAAPAVGFLVDILKEGRMGCFGRHAVETLGELGHVAAPAIPQLKEMSTTPDATMRQAAKDALDKITVRAERSQSIVSGPTAWTMRETAAA